jgi:4-methyl-5(b-hydroxyethyl)-thiazole monophosphate biosynthesis
MILRLFALCLVMMLMRFSHSIVLRTHKIMSLKHGLSKVRLSHEAAAKSVLVPVADGSEEIEIVTIIDTLVRAGAHVTLASVGAHLMVECSRGVKLTAECYIADCLHHPWDMIVCPGGMPGSQYLSDSEPLIQLLKKQVATGKHLAAICAAPAVVLAHHGLLDGRIATCYPVPKFSQKIERYVVQRVVEDENIITSQGPGTALQFSLKLVEALFGAEKAEQLRDEMVA